MSEAIDLWQTIIDEGVAALDLRVVRGGNGALLTLQVGPRELPSNILMAAHAAIEIDKLIAFGLAEEASAHAVQLRQTLLQAMSASHPSHDLKMATAEVTDRYRIALGRAVRRAAGDNPGERLAAIALPHE